MALSVIGGRNSLPLTKENTEMNLRHDHLWPFDRFVRGCNGEYRPVQRRAAATPSEHLRKKKELGASISRRRRRLAAHEVDGAERLDVAALVFLYFLGLPLVAPASRRLHSSLTLPDEIFYDEKTDLYEMRLRRPGECRPQRRSSMSFAETL